MTSFFQPFLPLVQGFFRFDMLAVVMAGLVTFLGVVVLRFAWRYLQGDPRRLRFLGWMVLTLFSVMVLVTANHLLVLLGAWTATSLSLHRLLLHHPERLGAVYSARKKFVFSRLAELLLLAACLVLHAAHGTWRIDELVVSIAGGERGGLPLAAYLLAFTAMLKSAQFPFHSWLPDTMDTPTPVSALMHAGVINAGGFLILRLAPVLIAAPGALQLLAVVGSLTAVFGAVVMLAQPGVKRALAFSTIAQMGFMMVQIGLGAWGLALLHLVAHSMYKAHAFLESGSTVGTVPRAAIPLATRPLVVGMVTAMLWVWVLAGIVHRLMPSASGSPFIFLGILGGAVAYGIARAASAHPMSLLRAMVAGVAVILVSLGLHWLAGILPFPTPPAAPWWLLVVVATAFIGLFIFQSWLWRASAHGIGRQLYVHALSGFYLNTIANRCLSRLWPSVK